MSHNSNLVLLSGIPASGKSSFARWYSNKLNLENWDVDSRRGLPSQETIQRGVIIDWGFPVSYISQVCEYKANGFEIWWFDGDRVAARRSFMKRARVMEKLSGSNFSARIRQFDAQMRAIENAWREIEGVFENRILSTLSNQGKYLSCEKIYKLMVDQLTQK